MVNVTDSTSISVMKIFLSFWWLHLFVLISVGFHRSMSLFMNSLSILMVNQLLTRSLGMMKMKILYVLHLHCPKVHDYHIQAVSVGVIAAWEDLLDMQFHGFFGLPDFLSLCWWFCSTLSNFGSCRHLINPQKVPIFLGTSVLGEGFTLRIKFSNEQLTGGVELLRYYFYKSGPLVCLSYGMTKLWLLFNLFPWRNSFSGFYVHLVTSWSLFFSFKFRTSILQLRFSSNQCLTLFIKARIMFFLLLRCGRNYFAGFMAAVALLLMYQQLMLAVTIQPQLKGRLYIAILWTRILGHVKMLSLSLGRWSTYMLVWFSNRIVNMYVYCSNLMDA